MQNALTPCFFNITKLKIFHGLYKVASRIPKARIDAGVLLLHWGVTTLQTRANVVKDVKQ